MTTALSTGDTLTNTEWLRTMALAHTSAGSLSEYHCWRKAYNKLLDLVNNEGYPLDDIRDFIDNYGAKAFVDGHYETWAQITEELGVSNEAVEAFVEEFGVENIGSFEDAYCGEYECGAHFAQELVESGCYLNMDNMPDFVVIDWEATWQNLSDDYVEVDGHIFNKHF